MALTRRQHEVLGVIREFIDTNGYSPSLEEVGERLGLSSVATVHKHVSHLVQKGFVRRAWNQNRSVELVDPGETTGGTRLPLSGTIAAGVPLDAVATDESIDVPTDMVHDPDNSFVLKVAGNSMIDQQIRDGDFAVVEQRSTARDGETVVALIDGSEATLKRYFAEGPTIRLEPANPEIEPIVVAAERVQIQGVLVGILRKY